MKSFLLTNLVRWTLQPSVSFSALLCQLSSSREKTHTLSEPKLSRWRWKARCAWCASAEVLFLFRSTTIDMRPNNAWPSTTSWTTIRHPSSMQLSNYCKIIRRTRAWSTPTTPRVKTWTTQTLYSSSSPPSWKKKSTQWTKRPPKRPVVKRERNRRIQQRVRKPSSILPSVRIVLAWEELESPIQKTRNKRQFERFIGLGAS